VCESGPEIEITGDRVNGINAKGAIFFLNNVQKSQTIRGNRVVGGIN